MTIDKLPAWARLRKVPKSAGIQNRPWSDYLEYLQDPEKAVWWLAWLDKFENAKGRLIFNGSDEFYIAGELFIGTFEDSLHKWSWSGHATLSSNQCIRY